MEDEDEEKVEEWLNHYLCARCGCEWEDIWSCCCDDRCPQCNASMSPFQSYPLKDQED